MRQDTRVINGALVSFRPEAVLTDAVPLGKLAAAKDARWLVAERVRRRATLAGGLVLCGSLLAHFALVAVALRKDPATPPAAAQEISVEVVPDVPKLELPKLDLPKLDGPKPGSPTPAGGANPATAPAPPAPPPAAQKAPPAPPPAKPQPQAEAEVKSLQDELAALQAQRAALEAERSAALQAPSPEPSSPEPATPAGGLGSLRDSFQAIALPSASEQGDEPVGYAAIVFSQLAKAKAIGEQMGQPGTAAIRFSIDDKGALRDVQLVQSSGIPTLDAEALAVVHKAAPFPPPPTGAQRDFSANVSFVGHGGP
jgi:periplasmic protein TonB